MQKKKQFLNLLSRTMSRAAMLALAIVFVIALILDLHPASPGPNLQSTSQLHRRAGRGNPLAGLTMDKAGNLYGTASGIASATLARSSDYRRTGSGWIFTQLYSFRWRQRRGFSTKPE